MHKEVRQKNEAHYVSAWSTSWGIFIYIYIYMKQMLLIELTEIKEVNNENM